MTHRSHIGAAAVELETADAEGLLFTADPSALLPRDRLGDLLVAARAALRGGQATLPHYRSSALRSREKRPGDPVTEADHASNGAILGVLAERRPADPVLSEESAPPDASVMGGRLWVVDPLDGTREFIDGIDEFAAMVGLAEQGEAVLGAFFVPGSRRLYLGVSDVGAWAAECRVEAGPGSDIEVGPLRQVRVDARAVTNLRLVRSRSHPDDRLLAIEQELGAAAVIPSGSVGVKCARIAEGEADLYVHPVPYLKEWDTCAPEAVLRGAGGRVTDCGGSPLRYGKVTPRQPSGILAGDPVSWSDALPLVRGLCEPIL